MTIEQINVFLHQYQDAVYRMDDLSRSLEKLSTEYSKLRGIQIWLWIESLENHYWFNKYIDRYLYLELHEFGSNKMSKVKKIKDRLEVQGFELEEQLTDINHCIEEYRSLYDKLDYYNEHREKENIREPLNFRFRGKEEWIS